NTANTPIMPIAAADVMSSVQPDHVMVCRAWPIRHADHIASITVAEPSRSATKPRRPRNPYTAIASAITDAISASTGALSAWANANNGTHATAAALMRQLGLP